MCVYMCMCLCVFGGGGEGGRLHKNLFRINLRPYQLDFMFLGHICVKM